MLAGAGDGNGIQQFKEVEIQTRQQFVKSAFLWRQFAPGIELLLRLAENLIDGMRGVQLVIPEFRHPLVCQLQLVAQVGESVVHRCG